MKWIVLFLALAACSSTPPPMPTEYDVVLKRAKPTNDEARRQECSWIDTSHRAREEARRLRDRDLHVPGQWRSPTRTPAQRNLAVLQSRSQQIGCQVAAASAPFDQCFQRCTQFTERTKEQCFDACNK